MPRPRKLTNVRSLLERTETFCEALMKANDRYNARIGESFLDEANAIRFLAKMILCKHAAKGTRKDLYVETQP